MNNHSATQSSGSSGATMNAQAVLDQTRKELQEYLLGESVSPKAGNARKPINLGATASGNSARQARSSAAHKNVNSIDWIGLAKSGVSTWWRDHPLHVGATVLTPVVSDYVRRKPVATLAVAAAAGAALVLFRPWRMASVTALGMSLVRSSNLPVMAASLVATVAENLQKDQS